MGFKAAKRLGFTIAELLMVIVVIAIVAGVVIVGYNGVQGKAQDASYTRAVEEWERLIRLEYTFTHQLPVTATRYCLGNASGNFSANSDFGAGVCEIQNSVTTASYNQAFVDQFTKTKIDFPNGNLPTLKATGSGITVKARGVSILISFDSDANQYTVELYWKNNKPGSCSQGTDTGGISGIATCKRSFTLGG